MPRSAFLRVFALWLLGASLFYAGGCVGDEAARPASGSSDAGPGGDGGARDDGTPLTDAAEGGSPCEGARYGFVLSSVDPCAVPTATSTLDLGGVASIDTTNGTITATGGATSPLPGAVVWKAPSGLELRIVAATSLVIPAGTKISVKGTQPLVLLVSGDARIEGELLLNGAGSEPGAGARTAAECADGAGKDGGGDFVTKGPGAGGGGFGAAGGSGGAGGSASGGAGGKPSSTPELDPFLGGCPGGAGAGVTRGGVPGGAVQISVGGDLQVSGTISVSGGGGLAPSFGGSGSGGGSGGAILLEARGRISGSGKLTANGGGGSSAGSENGADGAVAEDSPAAGGTCSGCRAGGVGGAKLQTGGGPGENGSSEEHGGGGGGGAGRIALRAPTVSFAGLASPPAATRGL